MWTIRSPPVINSPVCRPAVARAPLPDVSIPV
jgi:hypothetical protein